MEHRISLIAAAGFTTTLLLSNPCATEAQVSEARQQMQNARKLYAMAVDAISAGRFADAKTPLDDLRANVILICERQLQEKFERTLQEKDRSIWVQKVRDMDGAAGRVKVLASLMASSLDNAANSSNLRDLKDRWQEFDDSFKRFSEDFNAYWTRDMKELQDRAKKFQEACGRDCG